MAPPTENSYDRLLTALRQQQPVYTESDRPAQLFERLGLPTPDRAVQIVQALVANGEIVVDLENDDLNADPRRAPTKKCDSYRAH